MLGLYTWNTSNGLKTSIMFEEIAPPSVLKPIGISNGHQKAPGFCASTPTHTYPPYVIMKSVLIAESVAKELAEDVMLGAVGFDHDAMQEAIAAINDPVGEGSKETLLREVPAENEALAIDVAKNATDALTAVYIDEQIIKIVGHLALNTLITYLTETLETVVDFPSIDAISAA